MVLMYWSSKSVVHSGFRRSIEPSPGSARSMLESNEELAGQQMGTRHAHGVDTGLTKSAHTVIMVERRVDAVYANSVDGELLEERYIARACSAVRQRVDERRGLRERVVRIRGELPCGTDGLFDPCGKAATNSPCSW